MEKIFSRWVVAGVLTLGLAASPLLAQQKAADKKKGPNQGDKSGKAAAVTEPVTVMATAEQLARYGEEKKDPLALILAARMKQEVGETPVEREKENKGDKGEAKSAKRDTSVQGLLEKAKKLAQGRKDIVALADEVGKSSTRGAEGGPRVARTVVRSTAIDTFRPIVFRGGEPAEVGISGDGDSDLDLYVYDELGNLICRAESRSDYEICRWTPRWEGPFQIRVKNLGVANYYRMWTN